VPITSAQVTVGTTRVLLHQADADGCTIAVHAAVGSGSHIHLGDSTVTTANGFELDGHETFQISMPPTTAIYAVKDSGTATVSIMVVN
jgi:hypothetical protein